jgi:hypothetical protein
VDLHGLLVEEALQKLELHLVSLGGLGHPEGILLRVVTGEAALEKMSYCACL